MSKKASFHVTLPNGTTITVRASSRRVAINTLCAKSGYSLQEIKSFGVYGSGAHSGKKSRKKVYW